LPAAFFPQVGIFLGDTIECLPEDKYIEIPAAFGGTDQLLVVGAHVAEIVHHEAFFGVGGAVAEQAHLVFLDFGAFVGVFAFYIMPEGGAE